MGWNDRFPELSNQYDHFQKPVYRALTDEEREFDREGNLVLKEEQFEKFDALYSHESDFQFQVVLFLEARDPHILLKAKHYGPDIEFEALNELFNEIWDADEEGMIFDLKETVLKYVKE